MERNVVHNDFLSVTEVAAWLGISRAKIYQLIKTGDLPAVKLGRRRVVRKADIDKFIERNKTSANL